MTINIANIYPDILNMYGDKGNISALCYRMKKRGISVCVTDYAPGEDINFDASDIVYIGGGTEKDQLSALKNLLKQKEDLKKYAQNGGCLVGVCSGFELLGKSFYADGKKYDSLGVLNIDFLRKSQRMIGDIVIKTPLFEDKVIGFENHCGYVKGNEYEPLGKVLSGYGSGDAHRNEGAVCKNIIGTYIHGPLLPLNPSLTDYIISLALNSKYEDANLSLLDDEFETKARGFILSRSMK